VLTAGFVQQRSGITETVIAMLPMCCQVYLFQIPVSNTLYLYIIKSGANAPFKGVYFVVAHQSKTHKNHLQRFK